MHDMQVCRHQKPLQSLTERKRSHAGTLFREDVHSLLTSCNFKVLSALLLFFNSNTPCPEQLTMQTKHNPSRPPIHFNTTLLHLQGAVHLTFISRQHIP